MVLETTCRAMSSEGRLTYQMGIIIGSVLQARMNSRGWCSNGMDKVAVAMEHGKLRGVLQLWNGQGCCSNGAEKDAAMDLELEARGSSGKNSSSKVPTRGAHAGWSGPETLAYRMSTQGPFHSMLLKPGGTRRQTPQQGPSRDTLTLHMVALCGYQIHSDTHTYTHAHLGNIRHGTSCTLQPFVAAISQSHTHT
eukprot:1157996-Pelagomonas_calceolata.AAC.4